MIKKFLSALLLIATVLIIGAQDNKAVAADTWLYTDQNGYQYYIRDKCYIQIRSEIILIKTKGNFAQTLLYEFVMIDPIDFYSVYDGESMTDPEIESGEINKNVIASKLYYEHVVPDRKRIRSEGGLYQ